MTTYRSAFVAVLWVLVVAVSLVMTDDRTVSGDPTSGPAATADQLLGLAAAGFVR